MSEKKELSPPEQVYKEHLKGIEYLLKSITAGLKKHRESSELEGINWTDAGDIAHYRTDLRLIADALNLEGEYAPEPKTKFAELGFGIWNTGGGCTAYGIDIIDEEVYILISSRWGGSHDPQDDEGYAIGLYKDSGDFLDNYYDEGFTLEETLAICEEIVKLKSGNNAVEKIKIYLENKSQDKR